MSLRREFTLSSQSFSCVYFWKTQSTHNNLSARKPYSEWHIVLPFILFYFCIFEMLFKNPQEIKRKRKKHYRNQVTEGRELLAGKNSSSWLWASVEAGGENIEHREHGSRSQNTAPQRPGHTCESHDLKPIVCPPGPPSIYLWKYQPCLPEESWDT